MGDTEDSSELYAKYYLYECDACGYTFLVGYIFFALVDAETGKAINSNGELMPYDATIPDEYFRAIQEYNGGLLCPYHLK